MMKRFSWTLLAALAACSPSKSDTPRQRPTKDAAVDKDAGAEADSGVVIPKGKGQVFGKVSDADGHELSGVALKIGEQMVKTDNRGLFRAEKVPAGKQQVIVVDSKRSRAQVEVEVPAKGVSQVSLTSIEYKSIDFADVEKGGTIEDESLKITMPPKGLKDPAGKVVTGVVQARYAVVKDQKTIAAAPGGMRGEKGGKPVRLETYGLADISFYKQEQKLVLDGEAELTLPLGPNPYKQDQEVEVWSFDEAKGVWKPEGKAKVDKTSGDGQAKLKAKHFSWWSISTPLKDLTCVAGALLTEDGQPVGNMLVNGTGIDYLSNFSSATTPDGTFCMDIKAGADTQLNAFGVNNDAYFSWSLNTGAAGTAGASCGVDPSACLQLGSVNGTGLFAECTGNVTSDENNVLILSSGDSALDSQLQALLQSYGNQATIGPAYHVFDGSTSLDDYDAVYLQANFNWAVGDMPIAGQRQLINWINCGGGLVTVEWTVWKSGNELFTLLNSVYPMIPTSPYGSVATSTYLKVGNDPVIHNGLPDSFTFAADDYSGTEIDLIARPGATIFYDSQTRLEGVVGWDFNLGRVVSVSTCAGPLSLADPNYGRMMANIVDWLQRDPANEPVGQ